MPTTVQFRRGTTAQNNAFTGAAGEITYDTEKATLRVHDASTAGGSALLSAGGATQSIESSTTATPLFSFINTTDDATGPTLRLESDRATPADNDVAGTIEFKASDDAGAQVLSASILSKLTDVSNGSEDGNIEFAVHAAGSSTKITTIDALGLTVNSGNLIVTSGAGSTIGNLTLANGSITDSSGTISFGDENVTTSGNITGATVTYTTLNDGSNNITATAAELNIIDGNTSATLTTLADADRVVVNDAGVMKQVALTDFETYFETALDTLSNVTTVGALNSGSITSGFGSIDTGSSNITTTGTITGGIGVFDNIRIDNTAGEIDTSAGNLTIDSAGGTVTVDDNLSVSGNATVTGNLTVNGTTTTLATTNSVIADTLIELGNGTTGTPVNDAGIVIERGDSNNAFIGFDESTDKFIVGTGTFTGASTGNLTITTGTLVANIEGTSANLSGTVTYGSLSDGTITITAFADEDNMASNSATLVPTQQSVKAYVDSSIGAISSTAISEGNTNVTVADSGTGSVTVTVDGTTHSVFAAAGITLSQGNFVGTSTSAQYADLAEMYSADAEYEPGTVMSFGGDQEITQSTLSHDTKVAGVVSTAPAYLMNADLENGTPLALQGRTPVKVIGRIHKGDMLVASQTPGVACALDSSFYAPGCVIGKALESYDSQSVGTIEVVVGRI